MFSKGVGYIYRRGVYFIREGDGLVCRRGFFLAGKGAKEIPELFRAYPQDFHVKNSKLVREEI